MTPLERNLHDRIRRDGPITVADYMAAALGDPTHGYYRCKQPFGADGDFITAPEISQVFGELIGLWCVATWRQMGAPDPVRLVELGPGRGTLMADALRAVRGAPDFVAAVDLHLVETSPALRAAQARALAGAKPTWHDRFDGVPDGPAIMIANEFFDALPVEQFVHTGYGWRRRRVGIDGGAGTLRFVVGDDGANDGVGLPPAAPAGAIFETSPAALAMARGLGSRLAGAGGTALIIDYGHAATAAGETLQAVARHRYHDVLSTPGDADLTAHVDFAALATAARASGAAARGPVAQGDFLTRLGLETRENALAANAAPDQAERIRSGCRRLADPDQMGGLFKALALTHPDLPAPAGFEP